MAVQQTVFKDPQVQTLCATAIPSKSHPGKSNLVFPDGSVVSCQTDGTIQSRDHGSDGPFEQCDIDGQIATYWYTWDNQIRGPFSFAFVKTSGKS